MCVFTLRELDSLPLLLCVCCVVVLLFIRSSFSFFACYVSLSVCVSLAHMPHLCCSNATSAVSIVTLMSLLWASPDVLSCCLCRRVSLSHAVILTHRCRLFEVPVSSMGSLFCLSACLWLWRGCAVPLLLREQHLPFSSVQRQRGRVYGCGAGVFFLR